MAPQLPQDFKEFLQLLDSAKIKYLIVGGYAVAYHGYPRPTGDLDIWIAVNAQTAAKLVDVLRHFGFGAAGATADLFLKPGNVVRMGEPPVRIELLTEISGVSFNDCFARRTDADIDGLRVPIISLEDLKRNKKAAARPKDLNDLKHLDS